MLQSIGKNIRKLRKERNLTQEELAELLNITSQAVSKWENGTGMPDISQIIPLASVFGVSTDILFGISDNNEQKDVEQIIEELHIKNKNLEIDDYETYKQLTDALKRYPNNFSLLYSCFVKGCFILRTTISDSLSEEEQTAIYNECLRQSNVIFSHCPNTDIVINTKRELIGLLNVKKEKDKALNLINELPNSITDISSMILSGFFIGNKDWENAIKVCHNNICELLREMQHQTNLLAIAYMRSGDYDKAEIVCLTLLDIIKAIYKDETYTPPLHLEQALYRFLAICALRKSDENKAIQYLEEMYQYTIKQAESFQKVFFVKTPLLESYNMDFNYPYYEPKKILLDQINKNCFSTLSNNKAFLELKEKINNLPQ